MNRVTPTGPLTPTAPQWIWAAKTLSRLATLTLNSSAAPSSRSLNVATPTAWVSRGGTSWPPDSVATKLPPATAAGANASSPSASMTTSTIVLRILASFSALAEGANGTLGHDGSDLQLPPGVAHGPLMGERAGAQRRFGGSTVGAAEDSPLHSSNPPQIDPLAPGRDGCHAVAVWSSSAPTTSRTTGFSPDDMAQPRPLTAKAAAGMATSWRPERQHLNRGQRPDTLSTIGPIARFPIGVPDPVIRCRSGVTCPSPPGQRSPSRLCATRCKRSNGHWRPGSSLRRQQPMTARVACCRSTPRAGFVPGPGAQLC